MEDYSGEIKILQQFIYDGRQNEIANFRNYIASKVARLSPLHTSTEKMQTLIDEVKKAMTKGVQGINKDTVARAILAEEIEYGYEAYVESHVQMIEEAHAHFNSLITEFIKFRRGEIDRNQFISLLNNQLDYLTKYGDNIDIVKRFIKQYIINNIVNMETLKNPAEKQQVLMEDIDEQEKSVLRAKREYELAKAEYEKQQRTLDAAKNQMYDKSSFRILDAAVVVTINNYPSATPEDLVSVLMSKNPEFNKVSRRAAGDPQTVNIRQSIKNEAAINPIGIKVMQHILLLQQAINNLEAEGKMLPDYLKVCKAEIGEYAREFSSFNRNQALDYLQNISPSDFISLVTLFSKTRYVSNSDGTIKVRPELKYVPRTGNMVTDNLDYVPENQTSAYNL